MACKIFAHKPSPLRMETCNETDTDHADASKPPASETQVIPDSMVTHITETQIDGIREDVTTKPTQGLLSLSQQSKQGSEPVTEPSYSGKAITHPDPRPMTGNTVLQHAMTNFKMAPAPKGKHDYVKPRRSPPPTNIQCEQSELTDIGGNERISLLPNVSNVSSLKSRGYSSPPASSMNEPQRVAGREIDKSVPRISQVDANDDGGEENRAREYGANLSQNLGFQATIPGQIQCYDEISETMTPSILVEQFGSGFDSSVQVKDGPDGANAETMELSRAVPQVDSEKFRDKSAQQSLAQKRRKKRSRASAVRKVGITVSRKDEDAPPNRIRDAMDELISDTSQPRSSIDRAPSESYIELGNINNEPLNISTTIAALDESVLLARQSELNQSVPEVDHHSAETSESHSSPRILLTKLTEFIEQGYSASKKQERRAYSKRQGEEIDWHKKVIRASESRFKDFNVSLSGLCRDINNLSEKQTELQKEREKHKEIENEYKQIAKKDAKVIGDLKQDIGNYAKSLIKEGNRSESLEHQISSLKTVEAMFEKQHQANCHLLTEKIYPLASTMDGFNKNLGNVKQFGDKLDSCLVVLNELHAAEKLTTEDLLPVRQSINAATANLSKQLEESRIISASGMDAQTKGLDDIRRELWSLTTELSTVKEVQAQLSKAEQDKVSLNEKYNAKKDVADNLALQISEACERDQTQSLRISDLEKEITRLNNLPRHDPQTLDRLRKEEATNEELRHSLNGLRTELNKAISLLNSEKESGLYLVEELDEIGHSLEAQQDEAAGYQDQIELHDRDLEAKVCDVRKQLEQAARTRCDEQTAHFENQLHQANQATKEAEGKIAEYIRRINELESTQATATNSANKLKQSLVENSALKAQIQSLNEKYRANEEELRKCKGQCKEYSGQVKVLENEHKELEARNKQNAIEIARLRAMSRALDGHQREPNRSTQHLADSDLRSSSTDVPSEFDGNGKEFHMLKSLQQPLEVDSLQRFVREQASTQNFGQETSNPLFQGRPFHEKIPTTPINTRIHQQLRPSEPSSGIISEIDSARPDARLSDLILDPQSSDHRLVPFSRFHEQNPDAEDENLTVDPRSLGPTAITFDQNSSPLSSYSSISPPSLTTEDPIDTGRSVLQPSSTGKVSTMGQGPTSGQQDVSGNEHSFEARSRIPARTLAQTMGFVLSTGIEQNSSQIPVQKSRSLRKRSNPIEYAQKLMVPLSGRRDSPISHEGSREQALRQTTQSRYNRIACGSATQSVEDGINSSNDTHGSLHLIFRNAGVLAANGVSGKATKLSEGPVSVQSSHGSREGSNESPASKSLLESALQTPLRQTSNSGRKRGSANATSRRNKKKARISEELPTTIEDSQPQVPPLPQASAFGLSEVDSPLAGSQTIPGHSPQVRKLRRSVRRRSGDRSTPYVI